MSQPFVFLIDVYLIAAWVDAYVDRPSTQTRFIVYLWSHVSSLSLFTGLPSLLSQPLCFPILSIPLQTSVERTNFKYSLEINRAQ